MEVVAFAHGIRQVRNVSTNAQRDPSRNIVVSAALFFLRARRQHASEFASASKQPLSGRTVGPCQVQLTANEDIKLNERL
jgi:hypothetical protein